MTKSAGTPFGNVVRLSTTLADLFNGSVEGVSTVRASVGQRASEDGDDGARIAGRMVAAGRAGFFFLRRFGEATALQIGVGDNCHQRVTMQAASSRQSPSTNSPNATAAGSSDISPKAGPCPERRWDLLLSKPCR